MINTNPQSPSREWKSSESHLYCSYMSLEPLEHCISTSKNPTHSPIHSTLPSFTKNQSSKLHDSETQEQAWQAIVAEQRRLSTIQNTDPDDVSALTSIMQDQGQVQAPAEPVAEATMYGECVSPPSPILSFSLTWPPVPSVLRW